MKLKNILHYVGLLSLFITTLLGGLLYNGKEGVLLYFGLALIIVFIVFFLVKLMVDKQSIVENDYKLKLLEILETQDKKSAFKNIRQLVADSKITDFADLFRLLYDEVDSYGKGHVAECILVIAKYELSDSQVVDKEINAMAMIIEILQTIK